MAWKLATKLLVAVIFTKLSLFYTEGNIFVSKHESLSSLETTMRRGSKLRILSFQHTKRFVLSSR